MRAAIYLRVSSDARQSDFERREVLAFVDTRGWKVAETYLEAEQVCNRSRGPELARMLRDAWLTSFDVIVAWDLACLVRGSWELVGLLRQCGRMHVRLLAVRSGFDTDSGVGEATLRVANLFGKLDRQIRAEHIRAGLAKARTAGQRIGRPPRELDQFALQQLRSRGRSIRQIAHELGVATSTVARRLKSVTQGTAEAGPPTGGGAHE